MSNVYNSGLAYDYTGLTYDGATAPGSGFPIPGIFIAFDDGPYIANPAWTDVTEYVQAATTRRGKTSDYENFGTGLAQIVLNNQTQRFSPFNTSSPYYGKLLPRRQIKIVAQIGGINYDVYRGYIAGWPVDYSQAGYNSTVTLQCFDALGLMVNEVIPTDWLDTYTRAYGATHYWKCSDTQTGTTLSDELGGAAMGSVSVTPPIYFGTKNPLFASLQGNSAAVYNYSGTQTSPAVSSDMSFSIWHQTSIDGAQIYYGYGYTTLLIGPTGSSTGILLRVTDGAANLQYQGTALAGKFDWVNPHHYVLTFNTTTKAIKFYVDGQDQTPTFTTVVAATPTIFNDVGYAFTSVIQHFATFRTVLTAAQALTLYQAGLLQIAETTTARSNRLIAQTSYPTLLTDFTPTPAGTVAEIGNSSGVITELQKVSQSEGGDLFATKAGLLKTTNRTYVYDNPSSNLPQIVFSDAGGATLRYGPELSLDWDADSIRNDLTVTFTGGGQYSTLDAASIAAYGAASYGIDTQLSTPAQAQALATTDLTANAALKPKFSPLNVGVTVVAADWQKILGLELLDCIEIIRTPTGGSVVDYRVLVYEIEHTITPQVWETTLSGSARYSDWFTLDVSELDGPDPLL